MISRLQKLVEKIVLPILLGVLAFSGSILASLFSPNSLLIHPTFTIKIDGATAATAYAGQPPNTTYRAINNVKITNTGWVQAKNVQIDIASLVTSVITTSSCPEAGSNPDGNLTMYHKTKLERLSVNLECVVTVTSGELPLNRSSEVPSTIVSLIVVTADNTPATKLDDPSKAAQPLSDPSNVFISISTVIGVIATLVSFIFEFFILRKRREKEVMKDTESMKKARDAAREIEDALKKGRNVGESKDRTGGTDQ